MGPWPSYFGVFTSAGSKEVPPPLGLQDLQGKGRMRKIGSSILGLCATSLAPSFQARDAAHNTAGPWMVEMKLVEDITGKMGFQKKGGKPCLLLVGTQLLLPVFLLYREKKHLKE